jgi:CHAT domain
METLPTYIELAIRLQQVDGDRYRTVASAPDGATATGAFVLPFSKTEIDNFVLRVGRRRLPVRSYRSAQMEEARNFGSRLFEALMVDDVRDVFHATRAVADQADEGVRITLCLADAPELMNLPWEFLYERPRFLAQSIYSPVVRSLDLKQVRSPHPLELPLRVLCMISAPSGFDTLDVEHEKAKVLNALAPLCDAGRVTIDWLQHGTLRELDEAISHSPGFHVFHYIGHGGYDPRSEGGILVLENEQGGAHEVSGEELGLLMQDERCLRLAVLNSCEGARSSHLDPFSGVASSLVQYGIPAVVGMQFEITDEAAIAFSSRLYASLARGSSIDAALTQARRAIFAAGNDIEFGTPVLFLRGADAQLFEVFENHQQPELDLVQHEPQQAYELEGEDSPDGEWSEPVEDWFEPLEPSTWQVPSYLAWLPRPWQELLFELRWNRREVWWRWSNRWSNPQWVRRFIALFVLGTLVATIFGDESTPGAPGNILGVILTWIGFLGLIWVGCRALAARFRRLRHWWMGDRESR